MRGGKAALRRCADSVLRSVFRDAAELAEALAPKVPRLTHCLERLAGFSNTVPPCIARARTASGDLLGCSNHTVIHRAGMLDRHGGLLGAMSHLDWQTGEVWPVPQLDEALVGYVYFMAARDFPGVVKIGFSSAPEGRLNILQHELGIALDLIKQVPGTRVDECFAHFALRNFAMANEWFDLTGSWRAKLPTASFYTPHRMWRELKQKGA